MRRALAAALLAVLAGTSLLAGRDSGQAVYTCGTVPGIVKPAGGRLNTWNLSALGFSPGSPSAKPLLIRYKSITRLEYGRSPPSRAETREMPVIPCVHLKRLANYLTIFYEEVPADERKDRKDQKDLKKKEHYAVFDLGDRALRPTLRILESRSGKRIKYQDAGARKAAR